MCSYSRDISSAVASGTSGGGGAGASGRISSHSSYAITCTAIARLSELYSLLGGNRHQQIAARQLDVRQPDPLGAEHYRDIARSAGLDDLSGAGARLHQIPWQVALARARPDHEAAVGDCVLEFLVHVRSRQNVVGARRARCRVGVRKKFWPHQMQFVQPHVLHRARDGADVAWVIGVDENDADGHGSMLVF